MHVPGIIKELIELTGYPQWKLAKRLGVAQSTISKWRKGTQEPTKPQWDKVEALYFELKGWRHSIDAKIAPYPQETQDMIHDVVDRILKNQKPPARR